MTQATMHSHSVLEKVVYQLQSKGAIVDPCIVDDLIICIKTHAKVEFQYPQSPHVNIFILLNYVQRWYIKNEHVTKPNSVHKCS